MSGDAFSGAFHPSPSPREITDHSVRPERAIVKPKSLLRFPIYDFTERLSGSAKTKEKVWLLPRLSVKDMITFSDVSSTVTSVIDENIICVDAFVVLPTQVPA